MQFEELATNFACGNERLIGIFSRPAQSGPRGVLIIVGGPQYRAGSHRQFTLLARELASRGIPALRFDYCGMGDSSGEPRGYAEVDQDIRAALDHFFRIAPDLREVALWGLCDAATAALCYAQGDARVRGLVLANPWAHTAAGQAQAYLKHYYLQRLLQAGFWKKFLSGRFSLKAAGTSLLQQLAAARRKPGTAGIQAAGSGANPEQDVPGRMLDGLQNFDGRTLIILSGKDLTAREFADLAASSPAWKKALSRAQIERRELSEADHTFSRRVWRDQVAAWTADWLQR